MRNNNKSAPTNHATTEHQIIDLEGATIEQDPNKRTQ